VSVGTNISVITVGAVLAFATRFHASGVVSVRAVGGVLMLVGLASLVLQLLSISGRRNGTVAQPYVPYNETTATPLRPGEGVAYNLPNSHESEL
jgi:hypothetical protein